MKVAIDTAPLTGGHAVRGVGFYLKHLLSSFEKYYPDLHIKKLDNKNTSIEDCDAVHYPYFEPFFLTLPKRFAKPAVVTIHDLTPLKFPHLFPAGIKGSVRWKIQKRLIKNASAVITDSNHSKKDIHEILGIARDTIHVVYLAAGEEFKKLNLNESEKEKLRESYHLPKEFVLYVGDATPNKNLPVLLEAVRIAGIPLVMIGNVFTSEVFDRANQWNKDIVLVQRKAKERQDIHLLGFVSTDELVKLYNMASVVVQPSFYEGFGLPLLEAMSCGAPVITTKESSLPEVGGDAPMYVNYKSSEEFADAVSRVLSDAKLAKEMQEKSLLQAKKFSWKQTADKTVEVYKKILL